MKNLLDLSITEKPLAVNLTAPTASFVPCPWCSHKPKPGTSPVAIQNWRSTPCGGCGGFWTVLDGINGRQVFVQGIEFEAQNPNDADLIYMQQTVALEEAMLRRDEIPFNGELVGVELEQWEAVEVPF